MNLRDLEYLVAIADRGSFRKAAVASGVSQPTLSTQVKKLEADLGAQLVDRAAVPLRLTPVGEEVVRRARKLLRDAGDLRAAVGAQVRPDAGTLRLGVFPTLGAYLLPRVLGAVRAGFPDIDLLITEEKSADLLTQLDDGDLDAVIVALPVSREGRQVRPLFREDFVLAVPAGHPLADAETPLAARRLEGAEVILMADGHCLGDQVSDWLDRVGGKGRDDHRATSLESLRSMVAMGSGVTLLPALAVPDVAVDDLVTRTVVAPVPSRDLALVWRTGSARTDLLERLAPALVPVGAAHVRPHEARVVG